MKFATLDTGGPGSAAVLSSHSELLDLTGSGLAEDIPARVADILGSEAALDAARAVLDKLEVCLRTKPRIFATRVRWSPSTAPICWPRSRART